MRRTIRFGIGTLLVLVTVSALYVGRWSNNARRQEQLVEGILKAGGTVIYDWQLSADRKPSGLEAPPASKVMRDALGDSYFQTVTIAQINANGKDSVDLSCLRYGDTIEELYLNLDQPPRDADLTNLRKVRRLSLNVNSSVDLALLQNLKSLEFILLTAPRVENIRALSGLVSLDHLRLEVDSLDDAADIPKLTQLNTLEIYSTRPDHESPLDQETLIGLSKSLNTCKINHDFN